MPEGTLRAVAAGVSGVWTALGTRYVIELWSPDGSRTATITREAPWFMLMTVEELSQRSARGEPSPVLRSIDVDALGRIWVLISVADSRWSSAIRVTPGRRFPEVTDPVRHTDTILEIIDPTAGTLLLSTRFDVPKLALLPGQWLVESREDAAGRPILQIARLRMTTR